MYAAVGALNKKAGVWCSCLNASELLTIRKDAIDDLCRARYSYLQMVYASTVKEETKQATKSSEGFQNVIQQAPSVAAASLLTGTEQQHNPMMADHDKTNTTLNSLDEADHLKELAMQMETALKSLKTGATAANTAMSTSQKEFESSVSEIHEVLNRLQQLYYSISWQSRRAKELVETMETTKDAYASRLRNCDFINTEFNKKTKDVEKHRKELKGVLHQAHELLEAVQKTQGDDKQDMPQLSMPNTPHTPQRASSKTVAFDAALTAANDRLQQLQAQVTELQNTVNKLVDSVHARDTRLESKCCCVM
eukprot:361582-Chlamydomonas_euryale.AAC.2